MREHADDLPGLSKLAVDATKSAADVVQAMQVAIGGRPAWLISAPTYAVIRGITSLVGTALDRGIGELASLLGEGAPGRGSAKRAVAAFNGVVGDYLVETKRSGRLRWGSSRRLTPARQRRQLP